MEEKIGTILGDKYRLTRILGRGGMGAVFEAEHIVLNRRVAIKILYPEHAADPKAVKRFIREGQAANAIEHPNVIEVHDFGQEKDGTVFIVMERLMGDTLDAVLEYRGALPTKHAVSIALQVLSALRAAHEKKIVHRDLKPENIYLTASLGQRELVKLVDFGVARFTSQKNENLRLTRTGTVLGTPYYLAPEQANGGKDIDERIDLWSTGVVLYKMLTGRLPFEGDNYNEILTSILMKEYPPLEKLATDIPEGLVKVVDKALSKKREDRYQSASEMIEALMPFGDYMEKLMTTTAASVLRNSVLPPPDWSRISHEKHPRQSNPNAETVDTDCLHIADSRPMRTGVSAKAIMLTFLAVTVVGVVLSLLMSNEEPVKIKGNVMIVDEENPTASLNAAARDIETPAVKTASLKQVPKERIPARVTLPVEHVTIELLGLPKKAKVTLNGKEVTLPLTIQRSNRPVRIEAAAPGYFSLEKMLTPLKDDQIALSLKKKGIKEKRVIKKEVKRTVEKTDDKWRSNPFEN